MTQAMTPDVTLGDRFRMARMTAGLEQKALAAKLGVSRPLISMWERNKAEPKVSQVRALAAATGCSLGWLVGTESLNVRGPFSQGSLFLPGEAPAFNFGRSDSGIFGIAS